MSRSSSEPIFRWPCYLSEPSPERASIQSAPLRTILALMPSTITFEPVRSSATSLFSTIPYLATFCGQDYPASAVAQIPDVRIRSKLQINPLLRSANVAAHRAHRPVSRHCAEYRQLVPPRQAQHCRQRWPDAQSQTCRAFGADTSLRREC